MTKKAKGTRNTEQDIQLPSIHDWRTTDEHEIERRKLRAKEEIFLIKKTGTQSPIYTNFSVKSKSGLTYEVEIRDLTRGGSSCSCADYRTNGLGMCKHTEAVHLYLQARHKREFRQLSELRSELTDIVVCREKDTLIVERNFSRLPKSARAFFGNDGRLLDPARAGEVYSFLQKAAYKNVRLSIDIKPWLDARMHRAERVILRREYETRIQSGEWPLQETKVPLFPYQREGMLHLAFNERAILADEMGLGKTIQAIAACALLERLGKAKRVLVVTPASLKTEWEEQIQKFTTLSCQLIFSARHKRLKEYLAPAFFTVVNYEQMMKDALDVNKIIRPDIVILDEAQRIKNWNTKTAQAIKRLESRYAFVLTGTPIENKLDELYSLMDFVDKSILGPLFRFNREYYKFDEQGRPSDYQNLSSLHERIKPVLLRRRKADVETQLPERTDRNLFIPMSDGQRVAYSDHEAEVARLMNIRKRRALSAKELEKLMRELAMMRMICDTNYILDPEDTISPKIDELEKILEEIRDNEDVKVIIFSEWERMLELVTKLSKKLNIGYALHTGRIPQKRRRTEINRFKNEPTCRLFLSTDSGSTGLNLQNASVVINCDLPWNPAKLEQRIARAWRKHQTRPVTVLNLIATNSIEQRMLETLAVKTALSDGVLELKGDLDNLTLRSTQQGLLKKLEQMITVPDGQLPLRPVPEQIPSDRSLYFTQKTEALLKESMVSCQEQYPEDSEDSVMLVVVQETPEKWKGLVQEVHRTVFSDSQALGSVHLEIIDRATAEALDRLTQLGLFKNQVRAIRQLFPYMVPEKTGLSADERAQMRRLIDLAQKKHHAARVLITGGLPDEARDILVQCVVLTGQASAIPEKLNAPQKFEDCFNGPFQHIFGNITNLSDLIKEDTSPQLFLQPLEEKMSRLLAHPGS